MRAVDCGFYCYLTWPTFLYILGGLLSVNSLPSRDWDSKTTEAHVDNSQISTTSEGCLFSFYSLDTKLRTNASGSDIIAPNVRTSEPRPTPCGKFPQEEETARPALSSMITANNRTHNGTIIATTSGAFRPTFTDTQLRGCFAGTGGSTTYTVPSGYFLPNTRNKAITTQATKDEVVSIMCSDFMHLPFAPYSVLQSFVRSPICTSYAEWYIQHSTIQYDDGNGAPPGVFNKKGVHRWTCCGECAFVLPAVSILYFPTASYSGCSAVTSPLTGMTGLPSGGEPRPKSAIVDGSTLTFPSLYMAVQGVVSVTDRCGMFGQPHTNPTIAIPPGGLVSLSFSGGLYFDPSSGFKTVPYDPDLPKSCNTTDYGRSRSIYMSTGSDGGVVELTTTYLTPRPPHSPILSPPSELFDFDPAWKMCKTWDTEGSDWAFTYGAFDPPRVLQAMGDATTTMPPATTPVTPDTNIKPSASPGAKTSPDQPQMTSVVATAEKPGYSESSIMGSSNNLLSTARSESLPLGAYTFASGLVGPISDGYSNSPENVALSSEPIPSSSPYWLPDSQRTYEHKTHSASYDIEHGTSPSSLDFIAVSSSQSPNNQDHQEPPNLNSIEPLPTGGVTSRVDAQSHSAYTMMAAPQTITPITIQGSEPRSSNVAMSSSMMASVILVTAGDAPTRQPAVGSLIFNPFNDENPRLFRLSTSNAVTAEPPRSGQTLPLTRESSKNRLTLDLPSLLTGDNGIASISGDIEIHFSGISVSRGSSGNVIIDLQTETPDKTTASRELSTSERLSTRTEDPSDLSAQVFTSSSSTAHTLDTSSMSSDTTFRPGSVTLSASTTTASSIASSTVSSTASAVRSDSVLRLQKIFGMVLTISVTAFIYL